MTIITQLEEDISKGSITLINDRLNILFKMKCYFESELTKPKSQFEYNELRECVCCIASAERIISVLTIRFDSK
ncbi:MAG: EscE/YscE/SsaE family type III secretion system needle protein co-chaperone [Plesiomonas sp.]